jgi:cysteine desulfurase
LNGRYYFDWAASAPPVAAPYIGGSPLDYPAFFGNPSSRHTEGRAARETLEDARRRCAAALGVDSNTIYFTSGATEANAIILFSTLYRQAGGAEEAVLTTEAEHPSITRNRASLERLGVPVRYMGVDPYGGALAAPLEKALRKHAGTTMLALMYVNNETGAVSPLQSLIETARRRDGRRLHIHSDMTQAAGKIPFLLRELDVDSAALSAHKIGGPRGVGILYLRKPVDVLYRGGGQERGLRPGTENTAGAFYFAHALDLRTASLTADYGKAVVKMAGLIDSLRAIDRCTIIPECRGAVDERYSPYILQAAFRGVPGEVMTRALDDLGFAVSTGSACSSESKKRPVLNAMGVPDTIAFTSIRVSFGWDTGADDIEALAAAIRRVLKKL